MTEQVAKLARSQNVPVRLHNVIYKLFDELKDYLSSKLPDLTKEEIVGKFTPKVSFY